MTESTGRQQPLQPQRKAIVVGASSGIGAAIVHELARRGYQVAALARSEEALAAVCDASNMTAGAARAHPYPHNVTDYEAVPALFTQITQELGGLDLIIYVAGIQPEVGPTEFNFEKDAAMVGVNVLGAIAWLNQAAERFAHTGRGQIAGISSISGDRGRAAFPGYHTSKGALNIYLESLRNRLSRRGVIVTTIKFGFVDTALLANADKTFWVISPEEAATEALDAIEDKKQVAYIPGRWRWVSLVIQHIPSFLFRRLNL